MHKLSSLLSHILTYLHVMRCYNHRLHWFMEIFHRPSYLGYNSVEHEAPVLCIFKFQGLSRTQMELGFFGRYYFSLGTNLRKRSTWVSLWGPNETRWHGPRATEARLSLVAPMQNVLISDWHGWPKNPYVKTPWDILMRRRWRNTTPWNRGYTCEDWREKHCQSYSRSLLQHLQHLHHDEEGAIHL
jgi:hypothetical protein